ncbi:N-6 DNA methylase [Actinoplanes awajinensis subsp. mycoplanecinus]|uniref:N-6 DNA methylase n=1 Tax=Actinoplanes awajinensis subsp. mycoplanecinus TaxID=135947 RepID=A0A101JRC0_9ACTN|nr:N-6 DNA methylase [Actinoplanes awajinensis subsp. mycoplanecinus]
MDTDGTLISAAEVARLAGVTRAAVSNWRRRHADFPEAVGGGRNALFALSEVTGWLERQRKSSDVSDEVLVWQTLRASRGDDMVAGIAEVAEMFLDGDLDCFDESTRLRLRRMAEQSSPADVVSGLTDRLVSSGGSHTTRQLARAVARIAGNFSGTVFDPACGPGALLLAMEPAGPAKLVGQDINPAAVRLLQARCALLGLDLDAEAADSLQRDAWPEVRAELVVCDPPVGLIDWGRDDLLLDARWEFGLPTKAEGELAWLQHCYAHVAPGGRVVMVMPPSVAYRRAGKRIRAELVRRGVLEQIIALPAGMVSSHQQPVHVWVLAKPTGQQRSAATVRMVDLTNGDPMDLPELVAGRSVDVPVIDLLDEAVDLTPSAYLTNRQDDQAIQYSDARESLLAALDQIRDLVPRLSPGSGSIDGGVLRLSDLARAGIVEITDRTATSVSDQLDTDFLRGFLRSSSNMSRSTSASGTYRADVRGSRVPQMGIDEQRRYAEAFRALDSAEAAMRELSRIGMDLINLARDGLTSGALSPEQRK